MNKILDFFTDAAREGREAYLEGQPDREKQKELRRKIRSGKRSGEDPPAGRRAGGRRTCLTEKDPEISQKQKKNKKIAEERQAAVKDEPGRRI